MRNLTCIAVFSYNLVKGNWVELPKIAPERGYHGVASIDGEMYVIGGFNNPTSETLDTGKENAPMIGIWQALDRQIFHKKL